MKKLNLNSTIAFRLNDYGKDIYYHRYDECNEWLKARGCPPIERRFPEVDRNGYSYFQLHEFIHIYGKHMVMGAPDFWQDLNFYIEERDLEEVIE